MQPIDITNLKNSCSPATPLASKYPFPDDKRITGSLNRPSARSNENF